MPTVGTSLRLQYRGTWAAGTLYRLNDVVFYSGHSYVAVAASTGKIPSTEVSFWGNLADQGATGPAGAKGDAGAAGVAGAKGDAGAAGPAGSTGPKGDTGTTGATGPKGDTGATGAIGPAGPAGPAAASGSGLTPVRKTANYTANVGELVEASGAVTITLPTTSIAGARVFVRKIDNTSQVVTVTSSVNIALGNNYQFVTTVQLQYPSTGIEVYYDAVDGIWRQVHAPSFAASAPMATRSGFWYHNMLPPIQPVSSALQSGYIYYMPVFIPRTTTISTLSCNVQNSATATLRMALFAMDWTTGYPGAVLSQAATASASTATTKAFPLTANVTVGPGWYYISLGSDGTPTIFATSNTPQTGFDSTLSNSATTPNFGCLQMLYVTSGGSVAHTSFPNIAGGTNFGFAVAYRAV